MSKHEQTHPVALAFSTLLVAALTAFSAHAATSPGHVYATGDAVVRDSFGQCVRTSFWSKANATKECNPELFPEPRVAAAPAPVAAPVVMAVPRVMVFAEAALFAFDKAELTPAGQEALRNYREEARAALSSATLVKITGHSDTTGSPEYNRQLSLRRAQAVRDYLVKLGGNPEIMQAVGAGQASPIADNKTAAGRTRNRRVEVEVIGTAR